MSMVDTASGRERKEWIDVLRAIAIILVIFGHILNDDKTSYIYFVFTSPIKIPLFFAISGYLFRDNRGWKDFYSQGAYHSLDLLIDSPDPINFNC